VRFAMGSLAPSPGIGVSVKKFYTALQNGSEPPASAEEGRRIVLWAEHATREASASKRAMLEQAAALPPPAKTLVSGASGFLGRALVARLLSNGESIRVLARGPVGGLDGNPQVHVVRGDLGDPEAVERAVAGVELVYHLGAGMRGGAEAFESGTVWGTKNVVAACLRYGITRLVYVSSLSVLDHAGHRKGVPISESSPVEPHPELRGAYSQTKLIAENIVLDAIHIQAAQRHGSAPQVSYVPKLALYTLALGVELLGRMLHRNVPLSRYKIRSLAPIAPFDELRCTRSVGLDAGGRRAPGPVSDFFQSGCERPRPGRGSHVGLSRINWRVKVVVRSESSDGLLKAHVVFPGLPAVFAGQHRISEIALRRPGTGHWSGRRRCGPVAQ
jgi:hypothetical protein